MIEKIAVIGAGRMGRSIASVFASRGYSLALYDMASDTLAMAEREIPKIFELLGVDLDGRGDVRFSADLAETVARADLVIEAIPEKLEMKQELFKCLDAMCGPCTILASNTSVIPITSIGMHVRDKGRVLGMHFWNPAHLVPLVEVVETKETRREVADLVMDLMTQVGHEPVRVRKDIPGFIGNRLQHALKREAIALVADGVCDAETVDRVIKLGFGARLAVLGTLEQSDLVGLNLTLDIHRHIMADLDTTPGPHPYLEQLVAGGHLGMKTGRGFYEWTEEKADAVKARLNAYLLSALSERTRKCANGVSKS